MSFDLFRIQTPLERAEQKHARLQQRSLKAASIYDQTQDPGDYLFYNGLEGRTFAAADVVVKLKSQTETIVTPLGYEEGDGEVPTMNEKGGFTALQWIYSVIFGLFSAMVTSTYIIWK